MEETYWFILVICLNCLQILHLHSSCKNRITGSTSENLCTRLSCCSWYNVWKFSAVVEMSFRCVWGTKWLSFWILSYIRWFEVKSQQIFLWRLVYSPFDQSSVSCSAQFSSCVLSVDDMRSIHSISASFVKCRNFLAYRKCEPDSRRKNSHEIEAITACCTKNCYSLQFINTNYTNLGVCSMGFITLQLSSPTKKHCLQENKTNDFE